MNQRKEVYCHLEKQFFKSDRVTQTIMRKMILSRSWIFALSLVLFFINGAALAETNWKLTGQVSYDTGKYGTDTRTDTVYVPVTIKRYFDKGDISLTIPYIYQRSNGQFAAVDGTVFRIKPKAGAPPVTTNSGLGDIILKGSGYLLSEQEKHPFDLSVVGKIKFPTADDSKGLGTGEFDETVGLEFGKQFMTEWTFFADVYYTFIGRPAGTDLKNRVSFDMGLADRFTKETTVSVFYEESTSIVSGSSNLRDIAVNLEYKVTREASVFGGALIGLTNNSPDYGLSAGVSVKF